MDADREATTPDAATEEEVNRFVEDLDEFLNDPAALVERGLELLTTARKAACASRRI